MNEGQTLPFFAQFVRLLCALQQLQLQHYQADVRRIRFQRLLEHHQFLLGQIQVVRV